jgi:hypothetical protein
MPGASSIYDAQDASIVAASPWGKSELLDARRSTLDARRSTLDVATPGISCLRAPPGSRSVARKDASRTHAGCGPSHHDHGPTGFAPTVTTCASIWVLLGSGRQSVAYRPRRCARRPLDPPVGAQSVSSSGKSRRNTIRTCRPAFSRWAARSQRPLRLRGDPYSHS